MAVLEGIATGIVANVITNYMGQLWSSDPQVLQYLKRLETALQKDTSITTILQKASAAFAKSLKIERKHAEKIRSFLVSPEVEAILRQVFSVELLNDKSSHFESLKSEFWHSMVVAVGTEIPRSNVDALFGDLVEGCTKALDTAVSRGSLPAMAAKMDYQHRAILGEIAAIETNLAFLQGNAALEVDKVLDFERKLRRQIGSAHKFIIPPDLDANRRVAIDRLYVTSNFVRAQDESRGTEPQTLSARDFLAITHRSVILGNPGGGKSTFVAKLCHDLGIHYIDRIIAGRLLTPIPIVLRDYAIQKKSRGHSIVQYMESMAASDYQAQVPPGAFEYLLLNGRAFVIFDGLDELLDTADRQRIRSDVEMFADWYPSVPILVTSREVGYEQAPLDDRFQTYRLSPFLEEQVAKYAAKWFSVNTDAGLAKQKQLAAAFVEDSQVVPDLRANPLMLALMCNIYNVEGYIPRNRPEVYRKCAEMLFEKWDRRRGIKYLLPFEAYVRPAMHDLAYWIYSDERLRGGVSEEALTGRAGEYLNKWCFESSEEAKSAAAKFVEFCRGRAWVLTDTGTKKGGERLYQFTHPTFLEYFTAEHLSQTYHTPSELSALLHPHIGKREWDMVSQLAFQLKGRNSPADTNEILLGLLAEARSASEPAVWNYLVFITRCLEFMVPTPQVRKQITVECLRRCIDFGVEMMKTATLSDTGDSVQCEIVSNLLNGASENRANIAEALEEVLIETSDKGTDYEAAVAGDISFYLGFAAAYKHRKPNEDDNKFWRQVSKSVQDISAARLISLARNGLFSAGELAWRSKMTIGEALACEGAQGLFSEAQSFVFQTRHLSLAERIARFTLVSAAEGSIPKAYARVLTDIAHTLDTASVPWVCDVSKTGRYFSWIFGLEVEQRQAVDLAQVDRDSIFALLAIFAAFSEIEPRRFLGTMKLSSEPLAKLFRPIIAGRFDMAERTRSLERLKALSLPSNREQLLTKWIRSEIDVVKSTTAEASKTAAVSKA